MVQLMDGVFSKPMLGSGLLGGGGGALLTWVGCMQHMHFQWMLKPGGWRLISLGMLQCPPLACYSVGHIKLLKIADCTHK